MRRCTLSQPAASDTQTTMSILAQHGHAPRTLSRFALERLIETRTIAIHGMVDDEVAEEVVQSLLILQAADPKRPIDILLNCHGYTAAEPFAIYDMIRFIQPEVRIIVAGLTASLATVILLAVPKERRLMFRHAQLMIHQPQIGYNVGSTSDVQVTANEILTVRNRIVDLLVEATGQPRERVAKDTGRDLWLDADAALEYGLVSQVVDKRADLPAPG